MKKNSSITILVCGLITMVVTVLFYLLAFDHIFAIPMRLLSLLCLLLVEVEGTVKALEMKRSILGVTNVVLSAIHLGVVLVLSLFFVNVTPFLLKQYVLINLLIIGVIAIIDILLLHFDNRAEECNEKYLNASIIIEECLINAQELEMEFDTSEYKEDIRKIVELLKYANKSTLCGSEMELLSKLKALRKSIPLENDNNVKEQIKEVQNMIKLRTIQTKKSGKF